MRLLHDNRIDSSILSASSENVNYPVINLQDTRKSRHWRSTSDIAESVIVDPGGTLKDIFQGTTNLVTDPLDLSTANWTKTNCTAVVSSETYGSYTFTKITLSAASGYISQVITFTVSGNRGVQVLLRKGDDTQTKLILQDTTAPATRLEMLITWATKTITETVGTNHISKWIDDETVLLLCIAPGVIYTNTNELRVQGITNGKYFYAIIPQCEDLIYPTPFTETTRADVNIDETFQLPPTEKFIEDKIFEPWFSYDTTVNHVIDEWYIDATHRLRLFYNAATDKFNLAWQDGGTERILESQQFDDGTSFTNINQRLRFLISINVSTGGVATGSRLIVIPQESGAIFEDTSWSGNIDALSSTFPTLSIGQESSALHADSQYEYLRIYAGTLAGTVTDNDTADTLLAAKTLIFDKTYRKKLTASYVLITGHNLSAGAQIKLQGNDFNSWNGVPYEEEFIWDAETIIKNFTKKTYYYWQLWINDPNNPDTYIKIGLVYLGEYYQVEKSFDKHFTEEPINTDITDFSKSGQSYSEKGYDYKQYNLQFPYWQNSIKQAIEKIILTVGKRKPLFLLLDENNLDELPPFYCKIAGDIKYPHTHNFIWKASLSFREVF